MISACLIVKNEEDCLARCLESLREHGIDEIVVLDTGSTDTTCSIASRYTANVHYSEVFTNQTPADEFHFAHARNEALAYCTGDWVLSIDADERLLRPVTLPGSAAHARNQWQRETSFLVPLEIDGLDGRVLLYSSRLFTRGDGHKWRYRCHEVPLPFGTVRFPGTVLISHEGRSDCFASATRNMPLLRKQLVDALESRNGGDVMKTFMDLGATYRDLHNVPASLGCFHAAGAAIKNGLPVFRALIEYQIARCYFMLGIYGAATQYAEASLDYDGQFIAAAFLLIEVGANKKDTAMASRWIACARAIAEPIRASYGEDDERREREWLDKIERKIMAA